MSSNEKDDNDSPVISKSNATTPNSDVTSKFGSEERSQQSRLSDRSLDPSAFSKKAKDNTSGIYTMSIQHELIAADSTVKAGDTRKVMSQTKAEGYQFNSVWCGIMKQAKEHTCYICGCKIKEKITDKNGNRSGGHSPEMEHVITPGEFFIKFGSEILLNHNKVMPGANKGNMDEYIQIHITGSDNDYSSFLDTSLRGRIEYVDNYLNNIVTQDRVSEIRPSFVTKYSEKLDSEHHDDTVTYDKDFFIPQIKSYMVQFAYAHHICNQIKGNMPILEGSKNLRFDNYGNYIPNNNTKTIENYAEVLFDVIKSSFDTPNRTTYSVRKGKYNKPGFGNFGYIAVPKFSQYEEEVNDIYSNWFGKGTDPLELKRSITTRIVNNMLYHSALLRLTRRQCTIQRLKDPYYIRRFTSLIPVNLGISSLTTDAVKTLEDASAKKIIDNDMRSVKSDATTGVNEGWRQINDVIDDSGIANDDSCDDDPNPRANKKLKLKSGLYEIPEETDTQESVEYGDASGTANAKESSTTEEDGGASGTANAKESSTTEEDGDGEEDPVFVPPVFVENEEILDTNDTENQLTHREKKANLYTLLSFDKTIDSSPEDRNVADNLRDLIHNNRSGYIADLIASNVIYKAHQKILQQIMEMSGKRKNPEKGSSGPSGKISGGKRTKRRRGRGKSKKKVTRRKRVKRRRTVKKNRKRRRTRKR